MQKEEKRKLIRAALEARQRAYMPYSGYAVGAAVLMESGKTYTGCNIENASYGATNCAERTALFKAVSEGERKCTAIAIAGGKAGSAPRIMLIPAAYAGRLCGSLADRICRCLWQNQKMTTGSIRWADCFPMGLGVKI